MVGFVEVELENWSGWYSKIDSVFDLLIFFFLFLCFFHVLMFSFEFLSL